MRVALLNPRWSFDRSIYFGCREPHLPLELGYARALLEAAGHECLLLDGHITGADHAELAGEVRDFAPEMTVVTTAPSYLFWRCAQPELRVPRELIAALGGSGGVLAAVGPHGSVTPEAALTKLGAGVVVRGECEEIILRLAEGEAWESIPSLAYRSASGEIRITGGPHAGRFSDLPALRWPTRWLARHEHHHHRFGSPARGPGAEVEASRGCPYACSFCAKLHFRDTYRRRDLSPLLEEIDGLLRQIAHGASRVNFTDPVHADCRGNPVRDLRGRSTGIAGCAAASCLRAVMAHLPQGSP
jgi:B12-binding domain/radical SAM domain protein of rhizo-twelve system